MPLNFPALEDVPRILMEVALKPVAGHRFQPTGFPQLGAATYDAPDGTPILLVESVQSMANRLEAVCWDPANNCIVPELDGLPFVRVKLVGIGDDLGTTNSLLEFHRLNSPYLLTGVGEDGVAFRNVLEPQLGLIAVQPRPGKKLTGKRRAEEEPTEDRDTLVTLPTGHDDVAGVVNLQKLAAVCFKYDPNSLVHGIFLEKIAGRLRLPRALSAFIEASGIARAESGGVKWDRALPKPSLAGVDARMGYGNLPFYRTEFTAKSISAFFCLDLAQIRGYGLPQPCTQLLIALSLWKVRRFLDSNMRLRSACEFELLDAEKSVVVKRPERGCTLPPTEELATLIGHLLKKCQKHFAVPAITELTWTRP